MKSLEGKYTFCDSAQLKRSLIDCALKCGWKPYQGREETSSAFERDPLIFILPDSGEIGLAMNGSLVHERSENVSWSEFLSIISKAPPSPKSIGRIYGVSKHQAAQSECFGDGRVVFAFGGVAVELNKEQAASLFDDYKKVNQL